VRSLHRPPRPPRCVDQASCNAHDEPPDYATRAPERERSHHARPG
jgi:hypothetical protein